MRGTFRLLISCIVTLSLCVYTALHLNLPSPESSTSAVYMEKTWWVLLGIFAPELVVYTAWGQWNSARRLTTRIKETLQEQVQFRFRDMRASIFNHQAIETARQSSRQPYKRLDHGT